LRWRPHQIFGPPDDPAAADNRDARPGHLDHREAARLDDGTVIRRWTTAVLHADELGWLREALVLAVQDAGLDGEDE
jgi:hypothetical protein